MTNTTPVACSASINDSHWRPGVDTVRCARAAGHYGPDNPHESLPRADTATLMWNDTAERATPHTPGGTDDGPVYEDVIMTRTLGRGIRVQTAPEHALLSLSLLRDPAAYISEVSPGYLLLADQVEYQVTGYDRERAALTLRLANDHRPTARLTFGGVVDTSFRQVGEGPVCDGNLLPRRTEWRGEHRPELVHLPRRVPGVALAAAIEAEHTDDTVPAAEVRPATCDCRSNCGGLNACDVCPTPGPHIPGATQIRRSVAAPATPSDLEG